MFLQSQVSHPWWNPESCFSFGTKVQLWKLKDDCAFRIVQLGQHEKNIISTLCVRGYFILIKIRKMCIIKFNKLEIFSFYELDKTIIFLLSTSKMKE